MLAAGPAVAVGGGRQLRLVQRPGRGLLLRQVHLVLRLPPVHLQIDNLLLVLGRTENPVNMTNRVILGLVFGLKGPDSHARGRWRRANLNEALKLVLLEEQVLHFNPAHGGRNDSNSTRRASVAVQMPLHPICEEF